MHGEMAIQEMLKKTLISCGDTWLEWAGGEWIVQTRPYRARHNKHLLETAYLKEALEELTKSA